MSAHKRKTLVACRQCHEKIQYGRYDGGTFQRIESNQKKAMPINRPAKLGKSPSPVPYFPVSPLSQVNVPD